MTIEDILSRYDGKIAGLALELRVLLLKKLKDCLEIPDSTAGLIGYGYGIGYKDLICVILLSKKGVKLGFNRGSELTDPSRLLGGKGKVHRYAEIRTTSDIKDAALKKLITEALKAYKKRTTYG